MPLSLRELVRGARSDEACRAQLNKWIIECIPFNESHMPEVISISDSLARVRLPNIRSNTNHLGTLHAAALFTVGELAAAISFLDSIDPTEYEIVLLEHAIKYVKKGRTDVFAHCEVGKEWIDANVVQPLQVSDQVAFDLHSTVYNVENKVICRVETKWQLRRLSAIK